jgi:hypothetical protein
MSLKVLLRGIGDILHLLLNSLKKMLKTNYCHATILASNTDVVLTSNSDFSGTLILIRELNIWQQGTISVSLILLKIK